MPTHAAVRLSATRIELHVPTDDGRVVDVTFEISRTTSHAIRHLAAAAHDPAAGRTLRCPRRTLLERAIEATGAAVDHLEVLPGAPPRMGLVLRDADGQPRRLDVDLLDAAELLISHRMPAVAVGWPEHDWDRGLEELAG